MIAAFATIALLLRSSLAIANPRALMSAGASLNPSSTVVPLEVFQVEAPLRTSYDGATCSQVILQHDFAASYGTPFVGTVLWACFSFPCLPV